MEGIEAGRAARLAALDREWRRRAPRDHWRWIFDLAWLLGALCILLWAFAQIAAFLAAPVFAPAPAPAVSMPAPAALPFWHLAEARR